MKRHFENPQDSCVHEVFEENCAFPGVKCLFPASKDSVYCFHHNSQICCKLSEENLRCVNIVSDGSVYCKIHELTICEHSENGVRCEKEAENGSVYCNEHNCCCVSNCQLKCFGKLIVCCKHMNDAISSQSHASYEAERDSFVKFKKTVIQGSGKLYVQQKCAFPGLVECENFAYGNFLYCAFHDNKVCRRFFRGVRCESMNNLVSPFCINCQHLCSFLGCIYFVATEGALCQKHCEKKLNDVAERVTANVATEVKKVISEPNQQQKPQFSLDDID